jgi:hypothetical protein
VKVINGLFGCLPPRIQLESIYSKLDGNMNTGHLCKYLEVCSYNTFEGKVQKSVAEVTLRKKWLIRYRD